MPNLGDLPALEVAIGLAFLFFLLSMACSAVNEAIANLLGWRAKTLEDGLRNLLGDAHVRRGAAEWFGRVTRRGGDPRALVEVPDDLTAHVLDHWQIRTLVRNAQSSRRRRARPSYLPPHAISLAVSEVLAGSVADPSVKADPSLWTRADDEIMDHIHGALAAMPSGHRREALQAAATRAGASLEDFREHVEHGFDAAMERASGWYKRKVQVSLAIIAGVITLGLNIDTAHVAARLWTDGPLRSSVAARAAAAGEPGDAATTVRTVHDLALPIGWDRSNRPGDLAEALHGVPGWLITIAALNLGAPFWFDLLSRLARLRGSGVPEPPRSMSDRQGAGRT